MQESFQFKENNIRPLPPKTVSELSKEIHTLLDGRIGRVDVVGQVNSPNLKKHWYFTLSDGEAKIDCSMWASRVLSGLQSAPPGWNPKQGDQVVIRGTVGHYSKFGKTQLYVERIKPFGEEKGKLQQEFEAYLKKCKNAGWFDEVHKKKLPQYPNKIAVITSKTSAALQDVIANARKRMPSIELLIFDTLMQGENSPASVIQAIQYIDSIANQEGIDAMIVTRGGGGLEELWSFNDPSVVEAAFHCETPLVVAIGHESDTTIIELVADYRASTPTAAVVAVAPDKNELLQMIEHNQIRILNRLNQSLERMFHNVKRTEALMLSGISSFMHQSLMLIAEMQEVLLTKRPHEIVQVRQKRLLLLQAQFQTVAERVLAKRLQRLISLEAKLNSIGPEEVLRRGFSLTKDSSGKIIRSIDNIQEGDNIMIIVSNGTIESEVKCTHE